MVGDRGSLAPRGPLSFLPCPRRCAEVARETPPFRGIEVLLPPGGILGCRAEFTGKAQRFALGSRASDP